ncbi:t-SNARE [Auriculariales sp. MPI-PUGE-AT-0066]|nr:t-SNARE [Auriculariales sp. MPI-PUGE-AT-0066]
MSFADLEAGRGSIQARAGLSGAGSGPDAAFLQLQSSLSMQVFKINANVQGINKLIDQLGTSRDTGAVRKGLHDLTDATRDMAKRGTDDLKRLTTMQQSLPHLKTALAKTSHDFQVSLVAFQKAQQLSGQRQRTVVEGVKLAVDDDVPLEEQRSLASPEQRQAQLLQQQLSPQELQHQESLIAEREAEIREIESGILEIQGIFRDLGSLVQDQGEMLDNISHNVERVAVDSEGAAQELTQASNYQRKAGRRAACLMIILVVVVAIVLLAILN